MWSRILSILIGYVFGCILTAEIVARKFAGKPAAELGETGNPGMANIMDYLAWRGEFSFDTAPWNDVDALSMANLSYLNFHGLQDHR